MNFVIADAEYGRGTIDVWKGVRKIICNGDLNYVFADAEYGRRY